jgi:isocitrate/isopropylmalate dehydrogenase
MLMRSATLVRKPWEFDLLVMENIFGDIIWISPPG